MTALETMTVESTRTAILEKQTTASALVDAFYKKIEANDPAIGAYLTLCKDRALAKPSALTRWLTGAMRCLRLPACRLRSRTF